ncbi:MAG: aminotransferase class I/II-fold pyridoxal phosphate-dependent enzyme, partial [Paludibacteraceae bacterium]|nr:aminotransferase class I/II-fold pyridoxal phosphate-dependent enzyme [Paludibacteraceae bacterium]
MEKIQMVDLKSQYKAIKKDVDEAIQNVIDSSVFIKGSVVDGFAGHLASFLNVKHVIPVANGTDAIRLVLIALGLKPGDEVITPTFTFVATAEVAASIGCVPVLVDVDQDTFCMLPSAVEKAI